MAVYPSAVRTYTQKKDQVTTVDAADVNDLQDEMGATQRTLGVNPLRYTPTGEPVANYTSVAKRMDAHEDTLASLQNQLNILSFAASNGWNTPVLSLAQAGVTPALLTPLSTASYSTVTWNTAPTQDPGDMWQRGNTLLCVLGGWYHLEITFLGPIDTFSLNAAQNANNALGVVPVPVAYQHVVAQLLVNGAVAKSQPSSVPWATAYLINKHLLNFAWSGALHQGDQMQVQMGQFNGTVSGTATFTATYVRQLPGVT